MLFDKYKRNNIYQVIETGGINPTECRATFTDRTVRITYKPSKSWLQMSLRLDTNGYLISSGNEQVGDIEVGSIYHADWQATLERVGSWAWRAKHYINTPDLWANLRSARTTLASSRFEALANTVFNRYEQSEIAERLSEIKTYIRETYSLSTAQMSRIEARLDDAEEASRRLGRKDWLLLFGGTILSLIITDLVPPEVVQHIFTATLHALQHLFAGGPPPRELPGP
jgi:hypothetical protein